MNMNIKLEELQKAADDAYADADAAWDAVAAADAAYAAANAAAYDAYYKAKQELEDYKKEHGL